MTGGAHRTIPRMVTRSLERAARREVATPSRSRRRSRAALAVVALAAVLLVACGLAGAGWYYSDQLLGYPPPDDGWDVGQQVDVVEAQGVAAEPWTIDGPLGSYDGVFVPGSSDTWVLVVHGRGAPLADAAAAVPVLADADLPVVLTSFRNDGFAPDDPDGLGTLGDREWHDLQAWVDAAQGAGARSIVLYGRSMGGSVVGSFLQQSPDAGEVDAVILDSPLLSMHETLELQAAGYGIPAPLVEPLLVATKAVSVARAGMDFAALEHVARWDADVPALLIHGDADRTVPVGPTIALARKLDDATLLRPPGVGHAAWSDADPAAHAAALRRFLTAAVGAS